MHKAREIWDTNRTMRRKPRGSGWCFGCDMCKVPDGAKCPVCGRKQHKGKDKTNTGE